MQEVDEGRQSFDLIGGVSSEYVVCFVALVCLWWQLWGIVVHQSVQQSAQH